MEEANLEGATLAYALWVWRDYLLTGDRAYAHKAAVLVGKCFLSLIYHEALQRPVDTAPYATVFVDEVFDYVTVDFARGFDRLRKRHVQLICAIQRLGQLS